MPANIHEKTGIAYGVIDARKVPELYSTITSDGVNDTLKNAEDEVKERLRSNLSDFDAGEAFKDIAETEDEDEVHDKKVEILTEMLTETVVYATELRGKDTESAVEAALELVEVESGTFDIEEVVEAILSDTQQNDYFNSGDGEDSYSYEDGPFKYLLSHLGGAPLIWVVESPYVTYCRTCSPCVPNAGDLDNCVPADESNNIAYCVDPDDIEVAADKPIEVRRVDAEGNIGEAVFTREPT